MPPKIIFIGGAQATGKTTAVAKLAAKLNRNFPEAVQHIEGGAELRSAALQKYRRELNSLRPDELEKLRGELYKKVARSRAKVVFFVDHYAYTPKTSDEQHEVIMPNRPLQQTLLPHITHFVLLETSPEEVHRRRNASTKARLRKYLDVERGLMGQRIVARAVASETGIPLEIVRNEYGKQRNAMQQIERIIRRHLERQ